MKRRGFTLIELLLVISIIVLLMALLIPSMGAAIRATRIANARRAIQTVHLAVVAYKEVYGVYPLDRSPDKSMDTSKDGAYYAYRFPSGIVDGTIVGTNQKGDKVTHTPIFNDDQWSNTCFGGKMLVYFLMGPYGQGWHRPNDTNKLTRHQFLTAEWDPPPALSDLLANYPVEQGVPGQIDEANTTTTKSLGKPFAVFQDGFGLEGRSGGTIGYIRARPRSSAAMDTYERWGIGSNPFTGGFYWDCRGDVWYPGDGNPNGQQQKIFEQCPYDFVLLSPGPDGKYGYRVTTILYTDSNGKTYYPKGSYSSVANGIIDDIANYPLK